MFDLSFKCPRCGALNELVGDAVSGDHSINCSSCGREAGTIRALREIMVRTTDPDDRNDGRQRA
jgi:transcription elongation factor Elf1